MFAWSAPFTDTVWDWINAINTEVGNGIGFAGYNDWRLPNVKELQSIIDYGNHLPAVEFGLSITTRVPVAPCSPVARPRVGCLLVVDDHFYRPSGRVGRVLLQRRRVHRPEDQLQFRPRRAGAARDAVGGGPILRSFDHLILSWGVWGIAPRTFAPMPLPPS